MNREKLKRAEELFLERYPGGFTNDEILEIGKKHPIDKMHTMTVESFSPDKFYNASEIVENMGKIVSRASMVSLFEKPKFRDFVKSIGSDEKDALAYGLKEILHGDGAEGFEVMADILSMEKLAKWSLMTIIPFYHAPQDEVFVKPTTAKGVIEYFELENLIYKPAPTWAFYKEFRRVVLEMRSEMPDLQSPNNAAFTGFLMMSLPLK